MPINFSALSTIETADKYATATGLDGEALKTWKAIYFSLREFMIKRLYGFWLADALERGVLEIVAPAPKDRDGKPCGYPEYSMPIEDFYQEKRQEYNQSFDASFMEATTTELLGYAKKKYGLTKAQLLRMNADRMAQVRQREGKADESALLAEAQEKEARAKAKARKDAKAQTKQPKTEKTTIGQNLGSQYADWKASQGGIVSYSPPAPEVVSLDELTEQWGDEAEF